MVNDDHSSRGELRAGYGLNGRRFRDGPGMSAIDGHVKEFDMLPLLLEPYISVKIDEHGTECAKKYKGGRPRELELSLSDLPWGGLLQRNSV